MKCTDVQERLILYISHELEPLELETVAVHLETCATCRREYEQQAYIDGLLKKNTDLERSPEFDRKSFHYSNWLAVAAGIAALVVSALIFYPATDPPVSLAWENGQMEQIIELSDALDRIDDTGYQYTITGSITPELRQVESAVSYLEQGD
jgi:anti-sigma factor ChrR (cupin superfamily)